MKTLQTTCYRSAGGIDIHRASIGVDGPAMLEELRSSLDESPGVLLGSGCEFPGRYSRWDIGFKAPPLRLSSRGLQLECEALNRRGEVLLQILALALAHDSDTRLQSRSATRLCFEVLPPDPVLYEELRTRRRSIFTLLRRIIALFASPEDDFLGLYGAFGYALAFQLEDLQRRRESAADARELVLYLPDTILVVDHRRESSQQHVYDFSCVLQGSSFTTQGLPRDVERRAFHSTVEPGGSGAVHGDHAAGDYEAIVEGALAAMARGDLFEVVPSQSFRQACPAAPSEIFARLQRTNPAPYGALMNLGAGEYLVAASPEMYVRVDGRQVDTCPISGTIARGTDALEDAGQIRALLNSAKDEAELSMCTDVDRNDKSRVCEPGSVHLVGRRQIELYSRLIHTVDHVRGTLLPHFDALDAFLSHAWAVTVTGAPKHAAMQFIEDHESGARHWYGGALGCLNFNGNLNTGLTIRTIHIRQGQAEVRVGATLLSDSDPQQEEAETRLKASALLDVLRQSVEVPGPATRVARAPGAGTGLSILMLDHEDSFVHTLAALLQESGARVRTIRPARLAACIAQEKPDLVVLSPGPRRPADHALDASIRLCVDSSIPLFGVCLGLQGIVEYFGGTLACLRVPMHGKQSALRDMRGSLFAGMPPQVRVGRYHSLVAERVPECLLIRARSEDGAVMAVEHCRLPILAVQFHPESILSSSGRVGHLLLDNVLRLVSAARYPVQGRHRHRTVQPHPWH